MRFKLIFVINKENIKEKMTNHDWNFLKWKDDLYDC